MATTHPIHGAINDVVCLLNKHEDAGLSVFAKWTNKVADPNFRHVKVMFTWNKELENDVAQRRRTQSLIDTLICHIDWNVIVYRQETNSWGATIVFKVRY